MDHHHLRTTSIFQRSFGLLSAVSLAGVARDGVIFRRHRPWRRKRKSKGLHIITLHGIVVVIAVVRHSREVVGGVRCSMFDRLRDRNQFVFEDDDVNLESTIFLNKTHDYLNNYHDDFPKVFKSLRRSFLRIPKKSTQNFLKTVCLAYGYILSVR